MRSPMAIWAKRRNPSWMIGAIVGQPCNVVRLKIRRPFLRMKRSWRTTRLTSTFGPPQSVQANCARPSTVNRLGTLPQGFGSSLEQSDDPQLIDVRSIHGIGVEVGQAGSTTIFDQPSNMLGETSCWRSDAARIDRPRQIGQVLLNRSTRHSRFDQSDRTQS